MAVMVGCGAAVGMTDIALGERDDDTRARRSSGDIEIEQSVEHAADQIDRQHEQRQNPAKAVR